MLTPIPRQEVEDRIVEIENDTKAPIRVAKRLSSPHLITTNTKNWFESSDYYWSRKSRKDLFFHLSVDKKHLTRSLLIIDSLVKLLEHRGHKFKIINDNNCVVIMSGREINMNMRNVGKYQERKNDIYLFRNLTPTDILCIQMYENTWDRKEWKDTPYSPLEEKLIRIVSYTEVYAEHSYRYRLELEERWRLREIEKEKEIQRLQEIEQQQKEIEKLILTAENFDKSKKVEIYLNERKSYLISNNLFTKEEESYFEWGMEQYRKLNPLLNIECIL